MSWLAYNLELGPDIFITAPELALFPIKLLFMAGATPQKG
jgi:hypothetical protein